ncbi:MAG: sigma 54-interacting transcriptional regulator [Alphaproteobacteria bacterium]
MAAILLDDEHMRWATRLGDVFSARRHQVMLLSSGEGGKADVMIVHAHRGSPEQLLEHARKHSVKKLVVIDDVAKAFALKSELGGRVVRCAFPESENSDLVDFYTYAIASLALPDFLEVVEDASSQQLYHMAARVAGADVGVFINGPTGSGKEVLSRFIHEQSARRDKPFVAINCAAIPENMLESMLFGHEKGAFTGASAPNKGIFRAADGGTLLLDEISEMPLGLQAKLLRMLQEKAVTPVGASKPVPCDVRVLATTNRDMVREIQEKRFREDLFFRLNVFPLETLALAQRPRDILPIAAHILVKYHEDISLLPMLSQGAIERLNGYNWPGNVRELDNVMQRAMVLAEQKVIQPHDIILGSNMHERMLYATQVTAVAASR